jgi:hypothetical protein
VLALSIGGALSDVECSVALREAQTSHTLLLEWADAAADAVADAAAADADAVPVTRDSGAAGDTMAASAVAASEAEAEAAAEVQLRAARDALETVEPGHRAAAAARSKRPRSLVRGRLALTQPQP